VRHFYNHSDYDWNLTMQNDSRCSFGNVKKGRNCTVPPGRVAELYWAIEGGARFIMQSPVYSGSFWGEASGGSCNIPHDGDTGNVVLNNPAGGDVQTCGRRSGGNYDCARQ
jgi:hypothetical protein